MIIINKKRFAIILSSVLISVCTFLASSKVENKVNESDPTVSLPISDRVVVVDAGHGVPDERS